MKPEIIFILVTTEPNCYKQCYNYNVISNTKIIKFFFGYTAKCLKT